MLADKKNLKVSYPFGFGLSYTTFNIDNVHLNKYEFSEDETIKITCLLKNTGNCSGGEVVQAYIGANASIVDRPKRALKNFAKSYLEAGQSEQLEISIPIKDIAYWDENTNSWKVEKRNILYM